MGFFQSQINGICLGAGILMVDRNAETGSTSNLILMRDHLALGILMKVPEQ